MAPHDPRRQASTGPRALKAAPRRGELPASPAAERCVLAAALINEDEVWAEGVPEAVSPDDFYVPEHVLIWRAILEAHATRSAVTGPTIADALARLGMLEEVDHLLGSWVEPYLEELFDTHWASIGVVAHARMVHDYAERRRQVQRGLRLVNEAMRSASANSFVGRPQDMPGRRSGAT